MRRFFFHLKFFTFMVVFCNSCANPKTDYPDANTIANNQLSKPYVTETIILYQKPYQKEYLYEFFHLVQINNIDLSIFYPIDIDQNIEFILNKILATNPNKINLICLGVRSDILNRKELKPILPLIQKKIFVFPIQQDLIVRTPNTLILPENYKTPLQYQANFPQLNDPHFWVPAFRFLYNGKIISQQKDLNKSFYIQGLSDPLLPVKYTYNIYNSWSNNNPVSGHTSETGGVFGFITYNNNIAKLTIGKLSPTSFLIIGLKNSFLFFNFKPLNQNLIQIFSFFQPINIKNFFYLQKPFMIKKSLIIYQINFLLISKNQDSQITATYENGVLNIPWNEKNLPIHFKHLDQSVNLNTKTVVYDFGQNTLQTSTFSKYDFSKQTVLISN